MGGLEGLDRLRGALARVAGETVRGASWSARVAAEALLADVEGGGRPCRDPEAVASAVEAANPSMASLYNLALLIREACASGGDEALARAVGRLLEYMEWARGRLRAAAAGAIPEGATVAAFSYSSSVEDAILEARGRVVGVVVFESRPGGEGVHLARRLRRAGIPVELAPDALMLDRLSGVDVAMVGADTVTRDGCLVNKAGTRLLALAAREAGIPLVAVFESYKIHPHARCGGVRIARRTYEIEGWGPVELPVFDETPPSLLGKAATEWGLHPWSPGLPGELHSRMVEWILGRRPGS
ncbi:eIF2B alpha/beta/delta subunit family protein [Stetteria hydrogenophila]